MKKFLLALALLISSIAGAQTNTFPAEGTANTFTNTNQFQVGTQLGPVPFASLPSNPPNGTIIFCQDCQATNPCASAGSGTFAERVGGSWVCTSSGTSSGGLTLTFTNSPNCTTASEFVDLDKTHLDTNGQATVQTAASNSSHVVGTVVSGAGCSGQVQIATIQRAAVICDDLMVVGDWVAASTSSPGMCDDYGNSKNSAAATVGQVVQANNGAGTLGAILIGTPDQLGGSNNNGNVLPASQGKIGYYPQTGTQPVIAGDACTTDGNGDLVCVTLTTNGGGTGAVSMQIGSTPSNPPAGYGKTFIGSGNNSFSCITSTGGNCLNGSTFVIDATIGYGGSGGVDCTGATDSTSIFQTMINNAPDFSKFVFPANCQITVSTTSGSPNAITLQGRYGLEFWFEGRNSNSCDTGSVGPGGSAIIDNSAHVAGATIWYINQSQRLLFHNMTIRTNGAVDNVITVDQTASPPISTANMWENTCIRNTGNRNANFAGFNFSPTSTNNIEQMWIDKAYIQCSGQAPTSGSSNGYGIIYGNNANLKNEIVERLGTAECSSDAFIEFGSDFSFKEWEMSNSYTNVTDDGFNTMIEGMRSENATYAIEDIGEIGPHLYIHNDLVATVQTPIDCSQGTGGGGCGTIMLIGNEADTPRDFIKPATGGQNSTMFGVGNRNYIFNPADFAGGAFNIPIGNQSQYALWNQNFVYNTLGEFYTPAVHTTGADPRQVSPPIFLEALWNGSSPTQEDWVLQANVSSTNADSTLVFGNVAGPGTFAGAPTGTNQNNLSTMTHWFAFGGKFSGLNLAPATAPTILAVAAIGTQGSTTYTYEAVCHAGNGTTAAGATFSISVGNATLGSGSGANYNVVYINSAAGCVSYDVYRTACGGSGICSTNPTGKIGSISAASTSAAINNGGAINFADNGLAGDATSAPAVNSTGNLEVNSAILVSPVAPIIASGFGSTPSIVHSNGTAAFQINVGTGGSATSGVITMPTASNGWSCQVADMTTPAKTTTETAYSTTSITLTASTAWNANDNLLVNCGGF